MVFFYNKGELTLKNGSRDTHGLIIDGRHYVFYNEDLRLLKMLIEENCSSESKDEILRNKKYKKIDDFYVDESGKVLALDGNNGDVFNMMKKGEVNWVIKTFIEKLNYKYNNQEPDINYPHPASLLTYVPVQPYMEPGYRRMNQHYTHPLAFNQPYQQPMYRQPVQPRFNQPIQQEFNNHNNYNNYNRTKPKYYYLNLGDVELILEQGQYVKNHLDIREIKINDKIHEVDREAKARVADIFHRYINELEKEKEEIDILVNFIKGLLPKNEKVELLISTNSDLNIAIQYEDSEGIKNIKIKSYGEEALVYTKPSEYTVFRVNPYSNREEIMDKLTELVNTHNKQVEDSKEF